MIRRKVRLAELLETSLEFADRLNGAPVDLPSFGEGLRTFQEKCDPEFCPRTD